jgi:type II secretory pathway component GspD/PulD (secretin)
MLFSSHFSRTVSVIVCRFLAVTFVMCLFACSAVAQPAPGVPRTVNVFQLKNADAESLRRTLVTIFARQGITISADARTNSLVIAADRDTLEEVRKLIAELDKPATPKK